MELGDGGITYIFLYIKFFTSCSHPFKFYFYPLLANPYFPPNSALAVILFFISQSLCSLSLLSCLLALQHTLVASLSLSLSLFLYLSFFLSISFSHIAFLSPPPSSVCALNVVHTQALNLKMPHTVSITHFQCDDSQSPAGHQIQYLSSPSLFSLSVFPSSPLSRI